MKRFDAQPSGFLYVTGMGMVTALGFDAATCCAAARAGLSRARPLTSYPVITATGEEVGLTCHTVPIATEGFEGDLRLLRLATLAMRDLDAREAWLKGAEHVGCYLSLPSNPRVPAFPGSAPQASGDGDADPWARAQSIWAGAVAALRWRDGAPLRHAVSSGHTGFLRALEQASRDLAEGLINVAVVGGVDSLVDPRFLAWLEAADQLKTPNTPVGIQPGEAAAFLVIEPEAHVRARGVEGHAVLRGLAFSQETNLRDADEPPTGRALADALEQAMRGVYFKHQLPLWVLSDHTGEAYRAMDWGSAMLHLEAQSRPQPVGSAFLTAASFGDTCAASGALGLCLATTAFCRGYAESKLAALVSCADSGDRGALLCQAA